MPQEQEVISAPWCEFTRTFSNGETEVRYRQEMIFVTRVVHDLLLCRILFNSA